MRKSERYELNLVEGSDIVNPLVQDVPNYEIIDEEMGKNADAGVPLATELLTGTVHALTRENPNAPMFRFVATANYKSGDTFTVDGVQVTALLTSGEPLATGCYVINSNVLCCLVGTVLTIFCANSLAEVHAVDSDKLGGKDAEYYAPANSVVEAINLAQNANQISLSNGQAIAELNEKIENNRDDYSTEETVIGTWFDGKPIYRRCFSGALIYNGTYNQLFTENVNLVSCSGFVSRPNDGAQAIVGTKDTFIWNSTKTPEVFLVVTDEFKSGSYKIAIEYTKNN